MAEKKIQPKSPVSKEAAAGTRKAERTDARKALNKKSFLKKSFLKKQ